MKVLWYVLFVIVSTIFNGIPALLIFSNLKKTSQSLWLQELAALSFAGSLYFYGLLLARYSSFLIPGFYFLTAQIPIFVNTAFQATSVPEDRDRYWAELTWAQQCMSIRHKWFRIAPTISIIAVTVVTFSISVLVAIVYFTTTVPSTEATLAFIRIPMLTVLLIEAIYLPVQVGISLFESLSIAVRRRLLSVSLANLLPTGMVIATLLWTFSSSANVPDYAGVTFRPVYFPAQLFIVAGYFVITCLPSIMGFIQAARQQSLLLERRADTLTEAIQILRIPKVDFHIPALTALIKKLRKNRMNYVDADKSIKRALQIDDQEAEQDTLPSAQPVWDGPGYRRPISGSANVHRPPPGAANAGSGEAFGEDSGEFKSAYHDARPYDLRFQYLDWIHSLVGRLQMTAGDLQTKPEPAAELKAALAWVDSYDEDRREFREKARRAKPDTIGAALVGTVVTSVVSVTLTGFGSWLWTYVAQTLPS
jgi:hypothetical protein